MKFIRRPQVVEASQWVKNGDHPLDYANPVHSNDEKGNPCIVSGEERKRLDWEGSVVRRFRNPAIKGDTRCSFCGNIMDLHGWIDNPGEPRTVCPGDMVITGNGGRYWPKKYSIFIDEHMLLSEFNEIEGGHE